MFKLLVIEIIKQTSITSSNLGFQIIVRQERRRSQSIRGISWINQRNRQAIKEAILSGQLHVETSSQDDPFTRKNARMKPVPGRDKMTQQFSEKRDTSIGSSDETSSQSIVIELNDRKPPQKGATSAGGVRGPSGPVSDLFNAHNFDVDIDIAIPAAITLSSNASSLSSMDVNSRHASLGSNRGTASRGSSRPLSLEDYKRQTYWWCPMLHQSFLRAAGPWSPRLSDLNVGTGRNIDSSIVYWCGAVVE
ncbi:unnamed protein product [Litomosoides sigmodontis]|uniref:Uncharacterized protein n=1 Tax=Litomosoides sigmodontis TaxID=42156 RepID=A0A3P6TT48_LITSI|nr:unnamed protein product [Litomosoides sigmodontis]